MDAEDEDEGKRGYRRCEGLNADTYPDDEDAEMTPPTVQWHNRDSKPVVHVPSQLSDELVAQENQRRLGLL